MYVTTATWMKGTVIAFDDVNPHSIITLEERGADGEAHRWAIKGPRASAPERASFGADVPQPGDTLELCAFGYKSP